MNLVAIIPARGGSKSIPHKNLVPLNGKPLIEYTLTAALKSEFIDHIIVSTDDEKISAHVKTFATAFESKRKPQLEVQKRPTSLSEDETLMKDVLVHVLRQLKPNWEYFVLLQPTSPFRTNEDIDQGIRLLKDSQGDSLIAVRPQTKSAYKYFQLEPNGILRGLVNDQAPFINRQSIPELYGATGALYIFSIEAFLEQQDFPLAKTVPFVMNEEHTLDIDTPEDLALAEKWIASTKS